SDRRHGPHVEARRSGFRKEFNYPMRFRLAVVVAVAALAATPASSTAVWRQVTASGDSNVDQVGLWRAADGRLPASWQIRTAGNSFDLNHTVIGVDGSVG